MPDQRSRAKLTVDQRWDVLTHLALGFPIPYIVDHLFDTYGVTITYQTIYQHYKNNPHFQGRIKSIRNIVQEKISGIPLATKRGRLEALQKAFNEAMTWRTDKLYVDKFGEVTGKVEKRMIGIISGLVNEARVEMGGPDSDKDKGFDTVFIELIRKHNDELKEKGIDGFRITRFENRALDRYISK